MQALAYETASSRYIEKLGRYEILRLIAIGGMSELYLARVRGPEGFEKLVVVKRMLPQHACRPEMVEMFLGEARLAASLQHANIVHVFDVGAQDGDYFFAMEYLQGADLSALTKRMVLDRCELPLELAISIIADVASALHYAHEETGIVHCDVSPHNVFVTFDGAVKLVDFGIAQPSSSDSSANRTLKGKIRYMSPEQARREPLDRRADVFALGILLWELTTGRRLFQGSNDLDILRTIAEQEAIRPSVVVRDYPAKLEAIVMKALCLRREERYQTAGELAAALQEFARELRLRFSPLQLGRFTTALFPERIEDAAEEPREVTGSVSEDIVETRPLRRMPETRQLPIVKPSPAQRWIRPALLPRRELLAMIGVFALGLLLFGKMAFGGDPPNLPIPTPPVAQAAAQQPIVEQLARETTPRVHRRRFHRSFALSR